MIIIYATTQNGDGYATKIGSVESWGDLEDFEIRIGLFADDVVITFEEETKQV